MKSHEIVQLPNPKTRRWVKIDKTDGHIIGYKKSAGCYKGIKIVDTVKCDCGHEKQTHYQGEGYCGKCACTWFHPEVKYCKPLRHGNRRVIEVAALATQNYKEVIEIRVPIRFYWDADGKFDGIDFGEFETKLQPWEEDMIGRCLDAVANAIE